MHSQRNRKNVFVPAEKNSRHIPVIFTEVLFLLTLYFRKRLGFKNSYCGAATCLYPFIRLRWSRFVFPYKYSHSFTYLQPPLALMECRQNSFRERKPPMDSYYKSVFKTYSYQTLYFNACALLYM